MTVAPTQTLLADFLAHLHRGGHAGYYWTVDPNSTKRSHWWNGTGRTDPPKAHALYFGVNPTDQIPSTNAKGEPVASKYLRSRIDLIAALNCLFSEFDAKDYGGDLTRTFAVVEALQPRPSVVVDSGGGYHCYWLLDEPWILTDATERQRAKDVLYAWVTHTGGDPAAKDLARVLRVPGSYNNKYDPPRPVAFVWCELDRLYARDALTRLAAATWATDKLNLATQKVRSAPDGQKHATLLKASVLAGGVAGLLGDQVVAEELYQAIELRADDPLNAAKTIRDGIDYGKARPLQLGVTTAPARPEPTTAEPLEPGQGPVSTRIRTALTAAGYTFRLNELDSWVEVNDERLTDEIEAEIIMAARDADVRPMEAVRPFIISEARRNPHHPIRDYLNSLVWDGGEHIDALCSYLTSNDPKVAYPGDGPDDALPLHQVYLYRWLIGAVAKVFEQAQNMALVLAGPQNIGKSTLARWLCSGLGDGYFLEMPIDPHDKDNDLRQMRTFIWEIAELDATTRKADMSALKAFITRQAATVRKSYGRYDTTRPTVASFIGTVNKGEGFLSDATGNRRFLVTTITAIDHRYISTINVNQLWAQAVALYRRGEPWRLQANEQQAQADANAEHEFDTPLEGWLTSHFELCSEPDYYLSSAEIIDHLRKFYDIRLSGNERGQAMEISRVCQRLGVDRRRLGRGQPYVYVGMRRRLPGES